MPGKGRKFEYEFREGAVRIVRESGKPVAQVARDLGVNEGSWATGSRWIGRPVRARPACRPATSPS